MYEYKTPDGKFATFFFFSILRTRVLVPRACVCVCACACSWACALVLVLVLHRVLPFSFLFFFALWIATFNGAAVVWFREERGFVWSSKQTRTSRRPCLPHLSACGQGQVRAHTFRPVSNVLCVCVLGLNVVLLLSINQPFLFICKKKHPDFFVSPTIPPCPSPPRTPLVCCLGA